MDPTTVLQVPNRRSGRAPGCLAVDVVVEPAEVAAAVQRVDRQQRHDLQVNGDPGPGHQAVLFALHHPVPAAVKERRRCQEAVSEKRVYRFPTKARMIKAFVV